LNEQKKIQNSDKHVQLASVLTGRLAWMDASSVNIACFSNSPSSFLASPPPLLLLLVAEQLEPQRNWLLVQLRWQQKNLVQQRKQVLQRTQQEPGDKSQQGPGRDFGKSQQEPLGGTQQEPMHTSLREPLGRSQLAPACGGKSQQEPLGGTQERLRRSPAVALALLRRKPDFQWAQRLDSPPELQHTQLARLHIEELQRT